MKKYKFVKTLTSGVVLATALYPQAWAACPNGYSIDSSSGYCVQNACSGKCTYTYDPVSHNFWATKKQDVPDNEAVLLSNVRLNNPNGGQFILRNATIGEGITGFAKDYVFFNNEVDSQQGRGILILPSTFNGTNYTKGIHTDAFATYDLSAMKNANLSIGTSSSYDIIIKDDANLNVKRYCPYDSCAPAVNIQCRGEQSECSKQLKGSWANNPNAGQNGATAINTSYYTGANEDGNWEIWSDDGVALYTDSTLQKPLGKYDFDGTQTGIYKYDGAGNLTAAIENGVATYKKTSYTPAEAAAAIKKGNNNKITLTFK